MTKRAIAAATSTRSCQATNERAMIEFFDVPPDADEAFLAAWTAAAPAGATLHQALRDDTRHRFAALSEPGGPDAGALLLTEFEGDPAPWEPLFARWALRQGYIDARLD